ncbi:unnamed protein product [Cyprideis torosa]|uniref:Uncharacterized protein n=1 Tax=Cyprideis torosa TaxID=163714 RepID=A0A7R8W355_9CRUS|nr:unnamed protein product [Cyprideis torosa]CAG0880477.1 unnamed protein product [Cyprideis torosa]
MKRMNLRVDSSAVANQQRYLCEWFASWSEMQKDDFLPILLQETVAPAQDNLPKENGLVDLVAELGIKGRPPSLFKCQVKLFTEWFPKWSGKEKQEFLEKLRNIDSTFMEHYKEESDEPGSYLEKEEPFYYKLSFSSTPESEPEPEIDPDEERVREAVMDMKPSNNGDGLDSGNWEPEGPRPFEPGGGKSYHHLHSQQSIEQLLQQPGSVQLEDEGGDAYESDLVEEEKPDAVVDACDGETGVSEEDRGVILEEGFHRDSPAVVLALGGGIEEEVSEVL